MIGILFKLVYISIADYRAIYGITLRSMPPFIDKAELFSFFRDLAIAWNGLRTGAGFR